MDPVKGRDFIVLKHEMGKKMVIIIIIMIIIGSPDDLSVIVSDLKQQASVAGRPPFERVNILLFPILMVFRFSTCK